MAGAYCKFCGQRCFVYREVPDGPRQGWHGHMATCAGGMAHDLAVLGHTHRTAVNPADPDYRSGYDGQMAWLQGKPVTAAEHALASRLATLERNQANYGGNQATRDYIRQQMDEAHKRLAPKFSYGGTQS